MEDGVCLRCPKYMKSNGVECVKPQCGENSKVTENGECEECPLGKMLESSGTKCVKITCDFN